MMLVFNNKKQSKKETRIGKQRKMVYACAEWTSHFFMLVEAADTEFVRASAAAAATAASFWRRSSNDWAI